MKCLKYNYNNELKVVPVESVSEAAEKIWELYVSDCLAMNELLKLIVMEGFNLDETYTIYNMCLFGVWSSNSIHTAAADLETLEKCI